MPNQERLAVRMERREPSPLGAGNALKPRRLRKCQREKREGERSLKLDAPEMC